jgi:DivIVA domain-containing protein
LIALAGVLVLAALGWGVFALLVGQDSGLEPAEPDGRAVPLPTARPLTETDIGALRFDTAPRGYRMVQVDSALRRAAYDIGYKEELIGVLEAEVTALREGRLDEAEALLQARQAASRPPVAPKLVADEATESLDEEPAALGTFEIGAGPTIGALPGEPAAETPAEPEATEPEAAEPEAVEPEAVEETPGETGEEPTEEPEAPAEPDDSVDTDFEPARVAASDEVRPADGER